MSLIFVLLVVAAFANGYRAYLLANIIELMKEKPELSITDFLEIIFSWEGFWIAIFIIPIKSSNDKNIKKSKFTNMNFCTYIIYLLTASIIVISFY